MAAHLMRGHRCTRLFALLQPACGNSGRLMIELIDKVAGGGVYQSAALGAQQGVQVAQGSQYLDIVVARDTTTAYRGPEGMDHRFRILESLALPVKPASTSYVFSYEYTNVSPRRTL